MKLSVVIPVYNERQTVAEVLHRVQDIDLHGVDKEIIVVDDGSTDGTRRLLEQIVNVRTTADVRTMKLGESDRELPVSNIRVLFLEKNQGKGAALRRGFREVKGDVIIVQDADLEYDPDNFPALLEPIEKDMADVVYGSRFLGGPHRVLYFWHSLGNRILTLLSNIFTNLNLTDVETGYKMFRREILEGIEIEENRFGVEPELTAKIARKRCRVYEVPISYYGRTYAEGKKIGWKDGVKALYCILRYNLLSS